jgi:hypothetical protein
LRWQALGSEKLRIRVVVSLRDQTQRKPFKAVIPKKSRQYYETSLKEMMKAVSVLSNGMWDRNWFINVAIGLVYI